MADPLTYIPLITTSLALAIISFMKKTQKNKKIYWLISACILWIGTLIWTLNKLGVFKYG